MSAALTEARIAAGRWEESDNPHTTAAQRERVIMWALLSIAESLADITALKRNESILTNVGRIVPEDAEYVSAGAADPALQELVDQYNKRYSEWRPPEA